MSMWAVRACRISACLNVQVTTFQPLDKAVPIGPLRSLGIWLFKLAALSPKLQALPAHRVVPTALSGAHPSDDAGLEVAIGAASTADSAELAAHLQLGISLGFMREYVAANDLQAADATADVKEMLLAHGDCTVQPSIRSVVEIYAHSRLVEGGKAAVGRATAYVIHAHSSSFVGLIEQLASSIKAEGRNEDECFFWIDIFCMRPGHVSPARALRESSLALRTIGQAVLAVDNWKAPLALSRLWCLAELSRCSSNVNLTFALLPSSRSQLIRAMATQRADVEQAMATVASAIAQVGNPSDKTALVLALATELGGARSIEQGHPPSIEFDEALAALLDQVVAEVLLRALAAVAAAPSDARGNAGSQKKQQSFVVHTL